MSQNVSPVSITPTSVSPISTSISPFLQPRPLQCVTGTVTLFQFIQQPVPGSIIGQVTPTLGGAPIFLQQTRATPFGTPTLSSVQNQVATVCGGVSTTADGRTVLDVTTVAPVSAQPTPVNPQLLLLLLLLLLSQGQFGTSGISPFLTGNLLGSQLFNPFGVSPFGISPFGVSPFGQTSTLGQVSPLGTQLQSLLSNPGISSLLGNPSITGLLSNPTLLSQLLGQSTMGI